MSQSCVMYASLDGYIYTTSLTQKLRIHVGPVSVSGPLLNCHRFSRWQKSRPSVEMVWERARNYMYHFCSTVGD